MPRTRGFCVFDLDHHLSKDEILHLCSGHNLFVIEDAKIFLQSLHSTTGGPGYPSNWLLPRSNAAFTVQVEYRSMDMATEAMVWLCSIRVACRYLRVEYAQDPTIMAKDFMLHSIAAPDRMQIPAKARRLTLNETCGPGSKETGVPVAQQETRSILITDLPPKVGPSEVWSFFMEQHRFAIEEMEVFRGDSGAMEQARVSLTSVEAAREAIRRINANFWAGKTIHVVLDWRPSSPLIRNAQQTFAVSLFGWPGSIDTSDIRALLSHAGQYLHTEFYCFSNTHDGTMNVTAIYASARDARRALFMFDDLLLDGGRFRVSGFQHGPGLQHPALPSVRAKEHPVHPDNVLNSPGTCGLFLRNISTSMPDKLYEWLKLCPKDGEPRLSMLSCQGQSCSAILVEYNSATIAAAERRRLDDFDCGQGNLRIQACFDQRTAVRR